MILQPNTISHCQFFKLKAESSGGALYLNVGNMSLVYILNSYFCECVAPQQGGAVFSNAKNTTTKMCCFLSCATEKYVIEWWGTASNLESLIGSLTSQVTICKCNPDKEKYRGHIAYSLKNGKNAIEYTNLTNCECYKETEGYHVVYSERSSIRFSLGISGSQYCTLYSRESVSLDVEDCIFYNNSDSDGAISGQNTAPTPITMIRCIFGYNSLDIGSGTVSLKNCSTTSKSFGSNVATDVHCKTNADPEVDMSQYKIKRLCEIGTLFNFDCSDEIGNSRSVFPCFLLLLL